MIKLRLLGGVLFFALISVGFAYILGTGFLSFWRGHMGQSLDWLALVREYPGIRHRDPHAFLILSLGGCLVLSLLFSAKVLTEGLTTYGRAHWQGMLELRRNGFFDKPGGGFIVAKAGSPKGRRRFLTSARYPHCLMVAPTGAGKGISFVIPNLLLLHGSAVVLDVKGENYELTRAARASRFILPRPSSGPRPNCRPPSAKPPTASPRNPRLSARGHSVASTFPNATRNATC